MPLLPLRPATTADSDAIARLINDAFNPERFYIDGDRTNPQQVRALMDKGKFLLLFDADMLVGCVYVELHGERGYFGLLAVEPTRQRSGIGARLISAAEDECRAAGCSFMDLTLVNLRKELPPYYARFGYVESGTLPFPADQHPPKMPLHLIRMSKEL
jgi:predicted N-acetyltransferase YhbS